MSCLNLRQNETETERSYHLNLTYRSFNSNQLKKAILQTNRIYNHYFTKNITLNKAKVIPLPKLQKRFTVLRSPHVHKKSREQFTNITFQNVLAKNSKEGLFYHFIKIKSKQLDKKGLTNFERFRLFLFAIKNLEMEGVQIHLEFSWRNLK
uniref:Ribosomal protein S10 n=1 Tax=Pyramimonas parkeae TaxID=36894 RepID=A0A1S5R1T2_9CHLO|nr:ribosomal protein S10 [Pyramimonas parkeae]